MSDNQARIDQFRKMADADPQNELGHFSLGRALMDDGQLAAAVESFKRVISLNPNLSRVYQVLATALVKLGQRDEAVAYLSTGVKVADQRHELMPKNEMIRQLQELGAPVPELRAAATDQPIGAGEVICKRCGRVGPRLPQPPFNHPQGKLIQDNTCIPCWREWIAMGTKVINELRLPMNDPQAQRIFDQHMMEFLNLSEPKS